MSRVGRKVLSVVVFVADDVGFFSDEDEGV